MTTKLQSERRVFGGIEIRTETETVNGYTFLHGRAVPYNTATDIGWFREIHEAGSFAKSIKEAARALPLLLFHDSRTFPIGVADSWDDNGDALDGVWKLDADLEAAQQAARQADSGMLTGMSIGFVPIRSEWELVDDWDPNAGPEFKDTVIRKESRLMEVSLTPTPAFKDAAVSLVRSLDHPRDHEGPRPTRALDSWRAELEQLRNA